MREVQKCYEVPCVSGVRLRQTQLPRIVSLPIRRSPPAVASIPPTSIVPEHAEGRA